MWVRYVRTAYLASLKWTLLEVRIPKDVWKTPVAMEMVLSTAFHQTGGVATWVKRYWEGKLLQWFSLEIVSIEGKVFFFIRVPTPFKQLVEAQIYAQYPQAEINEVEDYTLRLPPHVRDGDFGLWGTEFELAAPDPVPIKTYVDYGLDKGTSLEPEQQIDPITPLLEFMGSIGKGEQIWFQIMVRATPKRFLKKGTSTEYEEIKDVAKAKIKEIIKNGMLKGDEDEEGRTLNLTPGQKDLIAAIERNMDKLQFDCGMRAVYIAEKDRFNDMAGPGILASVKQYNSANKNGFKPKNATDFDYPWQKLFPAELTRKRVKMWNAYRLRSYFYYPYNKGKKPMVLSSEELATIYHFPSRVAETPSFSRIESKKAEPPMNLPV